MEEGKEEKRGEDMRGGERRGLRWREAEKRGERWRQRESSGGGGSGVSAVANVESPHCNAAIKDTGKFCLISYLDERVYTEQAMNKDTEREQSTKGMGL